MRSDPLLGKENRLSVLQEACRLDNEVRMIMVSGFKSEAPPRPRENFSLKPFMIQELLRMAERKSYRPAVY